MHDERVERHIHGVQETLEQTDADYRRMLNEFSKSITDYKDDIFGLEQVFINATTSGRLLSLQDRLTKKRDGFMETVRVSLRTFRKRFDDAMQYLRQANVNFRKSFKYDSIIGKRKTRTTFFVVECFLMVEILVEMKLKLIEKNWRKQLVKSIKLNQLY